VNNVLFTHFDMSFFCACLPHGVTFKDASVFAGRCWSVYEPCLNVRWSRQLLIMIALILCV